MERWRYFLGEPGEVLRAILNENEKTVKNCCKTLVQLRDCWEFISEMLDSDYEQFCMDRREEVMNDMADMLDDPNMSYETARDITNEHLKVFYDLCDEQKVWIGR